MPVDANVLAPRTWPPELSLDVEDELEPELLSEELEPPDDRLGDGLGSGLGDGLGEGLGDGEGDGLGLGLGDAQTFLTFTLALSMSPPGLGLKLFKGPVE